MGDIDRNYTTTLQKNGFKQSIGYLVFCECSYPSSSFHHPDSGGTHKRQQRKYFLLSSFFTCYTLVADVHQQ